MSESPVTTPLRTLGEAGRFVSMRSLVTSLTFLLTACGGLLGGSSRDEVAWANSPDGRTHAILSETNGGATTSYGYVVELHLSDHGGDTPVNAGTLYGAVRSECAYGVDLRWLDPSTLALRFEKAQQTNVPASVVVGGRRFRIVVQAGEVNDDATCGGMLANRPEADDR